MATVTYTTLVSSIQETAENTGSEFIDAIPSFISRTERRLTRDIDLQGLTSFATTDFVTATPIYQKPDNALIIKNLTITSGGSRINLVMKTKEYLNDYWPDRTSVGEPRYYSNYGTEILVAPAPASAYPAEISYVVEPTALASSSQEQNYFTQFCSNALFYGSMVEASLFMKNPTAANVWESFYGREMAALNNEARRSRRDSMAMPASPAGGPNTLTGSN
jgi:hypothetical protein